MTQVRPARRGRPDERGAAVVDVVLILVVLVPLALGILQLGLVLHVRNTLTSAAAEGARTAAELDRGMADGEARTRREIAGAVSGRFARRVDARPVDLRRRAGRRGRGPGGRAPARPVRAGRPAARHRACRAGGGAVRARPGARRDERGTALVELVWLGVLLLLPLVYILISVFEVQRGAFAVNTAARSAGRAFVVAPDDAAGERAARSAARWAFSDQGIDGASLDLEVRCEPAGVCRAPGSTVVVLVRSRVGPAAAARRAGRAEAGGRAGRDAPGAVRPLQRPRRGWGAVRRRRRNEAGSVTPLIVGLALVLALAVAVVVDASAAYLHRQGLATVADGAALAGADGGAEADEIYLSGIPEDRLAQRADRARVAVADYLTAAGARERYPGLDVAVRVEGDRVVVELRAPLELPLTVPGAPERPIVAADAAAVVTPG